MMGIFIFGVLCVLAIMAGLSDSAGRTQRKKLQRNGTNWRAIRNIALIEDMEHLNKEQAREKNELE